MRLEPRELVGIKKDLKKKGMSMKDLSIGTRVPYGTCNHYINGYIGIPPHILTIFRKVIRSWRKK